MVRGKIVFMVMGALSIVAVAAEGEGVTRQEPPMRPERPDGPYVASPRALHPTSPPLTLVRNGVRSVQVNVDGAGNNIVGDAANEPSIAVDPNNPLRTAIGWRQFDTIQSSFRQAGYGWSRDGGRAWTFPGVIEPGVFRSDPVLDSDAGGTFYYNSLTVAGGFSTDVFRSYDGGRTWDGGVFAQGGDKQWMTIDRTVGIGRGRIYSNWTLSTSICDGQFTYSYDEGDSFEDCVDVPGTPQWGTMAVGPDGAVYVVGRGFVVAKSSTLQDDTLPSAFDFAKVINLGGDLAFAQGPNPGGLLGQAQIGVDRSGGPTHGNVYVLGSVNPFDGADPLDVHFARSTDGGRTWSDPVRVNDVQQGWQWFGTMSVAPTGRIDVVWNDTRNAPETFISELHYTFSNDAGETWSPAVAISPPWDPHVGWPQQDKIGDYYDMVSDRVGAHLAYAATFNNEQDVYFTRIGAGDCNLNGVGDDADITGGVSGDVNANGIPDECECPADVDGDDAVAFADLLVVLATWGPCPGCAADIDASGNVDFADLLAVLSTWGPCAAAGACCLPDGACMVVEPGSDVCFAAGGTYRGSGSTCGDTACEQPGVCCLPDGTCTPSIVGGSTCVVQGGVYQGDGASCEEITCPDPGACCLADGSCALSDPGGMTCVEQGGVYQGNGTVCDESACPPGACCSPAGFCDILVQAACLVTGGHWLGAETTCDGIDCSVGACCVDALCFDVNELSCEQIGGAYRGDGTTCAGVDCP